VAFPVKHLVPVWGRVASSPRFKPDLSVSFAGLGIFADLLTVIDVPRVILDRQSQLLPPQILRPIPERFVTEDLKEIAMDGYSGGRYKERHYCRAH
jgi:hypothetical protein